MRDGVVLLWAHLAGEALSKRNFTDNLGAGSHTQEHVQRLHGVARDGHITGGEDEDDNRGVADGSRARVLPREQVVEEGVVVGQVLAVGCLSLWCLARGGQVAELILRGGGLGACLVGERAIGDRLHRLRVLDVLHCL